MKSHPAAYNQVDIVFLITPAVSKESSSNNPMAADMMQRMTRECVPDC